MGTRERIWGANIYCKGYPVPFTLSVDLDHRARTPRARPPGPPPIQLYNVNRTPRLHHSLRLRLTLRLSLIILPALLCLSPNVTRPHTHTRTCLFCKLWMDDRNAIAEDVPVIAQGGNASRERSPLTDSLSHAAPAARPCCCLVTLLTRRFQLDEEDLFIRPQLMGSHKEAVCCARGGTGCHWLLSFL